LPETISVKIGKYEGKSISKLQIDILEHKKIRLLIGKILLFLSIISLYIEALVPSFHKPLKTSNIKLFGLLSETGGDLTFYSFIVGKIFSRKMMFKRAQQMEVAWSKVRAIRRMLEYFLLLLLHENARPHTANKTHETLRNFKWEVLEHPPYSL
jgi:hypothetical protein